MNVEEIEYGSDIKDVPEFGKAEFGYGTYTGAYGWTKINQKTYTLKEALLVGWSHGCPIARELTSPNSPYDFDWMVHRYADVNFQFLNIKMYAGKWNRSVYQMLNAPRLRLPGEELGKHDPLSVPESHKWQIAPMSSIEGYAIPRVVEIKPEKAFEMGLVTDALRETEGQPFDFLPVLSEMMVEIAKVDPIEVLKHAYAKGILEEENTYVGYYKLAQRFEEKAPIVWKAYNSLFQAERLALSIAEIPIVANFA